MTDDRSDSDDLLTKIMRQTEAFQATYNKSPDDIVMNGQTYSELLGIINPQAINNTNPNYGMNVSTIMGIQIYINEAIPSGQINLRSEGGVKSVITNIGKPSKPSKLSRFAKKRMIRLG